MKAQAVERKRILVVEDDADFRDIERDWLARRYDTVTCKDGEELLDELSVALPDLLILDIGLPGPDGLRLGRKLRSEERLAGVPILFLTGSKAAQAYAVALDLGCDGFLTKPVERTRLLAKVRELLGEDEA